MALAGLWLAALCPFTANYTAVVLTETLVIFLTALAMLVLLQTEAGGAAELGADGSGVAAFLTNPWLLAGIVVGFGTLVRPETPLLLFAAGLVLLAKWWRPADWMKLVRAGLLMGVGLLLPLVPWAARNWHTLHDVQFLAPRYSELPGEYTPLGIYCLDQHVDVAFSRCVPDAMESERGRNCELISCRLRVRFAGRERADRGPAR